MAKPTIFLSHITEEAELANIFKEEIESRFLGLVDVFQSSTNDSLPIGQNWLNNIVDALRRCEAILVFCSPNSIIRPWIHFECGAGWARGIEVVPLCHSGTRPIDLPLPLSLLQGVEANSAERIEHVFGMIASKLSSKRPNIDAVSLVTSVQSFEKTYSERLRFLQHLFVIKKKAPEIFAAILASGPDSAGRIAFLLERVVNNVREELDTLKSTGQLSYAHYVITFMSGHGMGGEFAIAVSEPLAALVKSLEAP